MGNKNQAVFVPEPDSFSKAQVQIGPGTVVTPIAENSEAVVYSTKFKSPYVAPLDMPRQIESVLSQNHGSYIVRPKNTLADGRVLQVKSLSAQPSKLYYVVRKQEGADKWIFNDNQ